MFPTNFRDLEWLVKRCPLPVVVKGVLRGDDAARCVGCGVKGIVVSNHGGRHLDTTVTTAEVIAEIAAAVGASAEIYVDGGIRRGADIVKALALGARAVLIGRPALWGLSVGGAGGVQMVLEHLGIGEEDGKAVIVAEMLPDGIEEAEKRIDAYLARESTKGILKAIAIAEQGGSAIAGFTNNRRSGERTVESVAGANALAKSLYGGLNNV